MFFWESDVFQIFFVMLFVVVLINENESISSVYDLFPSKLQLDQH